MSNETLQPEIAGTFNARQQLCIRHFTAIFTDLTVLNLLDKYRDYVEIDSFTI